MTNEADRELENYAAFIADFDFELSNGWLNITSFLFHLFQCLAADRQRQPPFVDDMYDKLLELIKRSKDRIPADTPVLSSAPVYGWTSEMAAMYPDGKAKMLHLGTLFFCAEEWIHAIGEMIPDRATDRGAAYISWPQEEWYLTNTFLQRFHAQYWSVLRDVDIKASNSTNFSSFEALSLAKRQEIEFDRAAELLKARNADFTAALERVDQAIEAGFPLEAITICESLICACLHNFLKASGSSKAPEGFARLIEDFRRAGDQSQYYPDKLMEKIDAWRRERNNAMHRFVARDPSEMSKGQKLFLKDARKTASDGRAYCADLLAWFQHESAFFLKVEFDLPKSRLN
ncbi:hypothetical protein KUV57_12660 [Epibacterium sp. DP7N7-1]|nr:hypothetical protein [Epibacterium sp. DP7N7-1]